MSNAPKLVLLDGAGTAGADATHADVVRDLRAMKARDVPRQLFRYGEARLATPCLPHLWRPFARAVLLRVLSRGHCAWADQEGRREDITWPRMSALAWDAARDLLAQPALLRRVAREVADLSAAGPQPRPPLALDGQPVYLRTDLAFGLQAGGSVAHTSGVLNQLPLFAGPPLFLTTDRLPTVRDDIETRILDLGTHGWNVPSSFALGFNAVAEPQVRLALAGRRLAFVYQRYALDSYLGVKTAREQGVPLVLEYNGSEIWVQRHWGGPPLADAGLAERIEALNLRAADVVVVVSDPTRDELVQRGIDAGKILVNPNGVDTERYSPEVDGAPVRRRYGLEGKTVIGFIGTFGPWHGAEVLAEAFGRLWNRYPTYRDSVRLLLVGEGAGMLAVRNILANAGVGDACVLTGTVSQAEGANHLAACDVLVAPHVRNADGTPFFGSPTKLFEYMAMGKGIVASELDQIGEVLEHGRTAWLVTPGDVDGLVHGLKSLIDDSPLRQRLGTAARTQAIARHTWREHTRRIIEKLNERCGPAAAR